MNQRPEESIWGTINTCVEIALNIYMITAVDKDGVEHNGIMAHQDTSGETLSAKAAALAKQDGEWLCFDENGKDVAMYEVLEQRLAACKKIEAAALREMEEIKKGNQILLPQYFGECPPPKLHSDQPPEQIRNGVYQMKQGEETTFAVHESIAEHYLTPMAMAFGRQEGEYHLFNLAHAAVLFHELKSVFAEVEHLVVSEDSLNATLHGQFPEYVRQLHELVPENEQIPAVEAPAQLFLPMQLEAPGADTQEIEPEEDYGEAVEYGIEP